MKKVMFIALLSIVSSRIVFAEDSGVKALNNFRDNVRVAAKAPFIAMPIYGIRSASYFNKRSTDEAIVESWKVTFSENEKKGRSNKVWIEDAKRNLENRNTFLRGVIDTTFCTVVPGLVVLSAQCLYKKLTGDTIFPNTINFSPIAISSIVGALWGTAAHSSMNTMQKQVKEIVSNKNNKE